jgi:hypothetical protein
MQTFGTIHAGVVVLEGGVSLPEGARVSVSYPPSPILETAPAPQPVVLPIFDYDGPPDIDLTNERIAEILDRDDASG